VIRFVDKNVTVKGDFVFFWRGWPSQWFRSPFVAEGVAYGCCEQYMMAEKARVFGDSKTLGKIVAAISPNDQKALGREVRGFDEAVWKSVCRGIVYAANLAKFQQNGELAEKLLATGELTIVEASPVDAVWGIGLAANHPDAVNPAAWRGTNWLGKALMQVRGTLCGVPVDEDLARQLEVRRAIVKAKEMP
jgi:ribA/ribD-fused uncharacterized protein